MVKIVDLQDYDVANYLTTEEEISAYLSIVLEENDPGAFIEALGIVLVQDL